jgi:transcriptional regulator with XRE-family HTH domain
MSTDVQATELAEILRRNIKARRKELGLTQAQLAKKLKVSQPFIAQIESGDASLSIATLADMAEKLATSPSALLSPDSFSEIPA